MVFLHRTCKISPLPFRKADQKGDKYVYAFFGKRYIYRMNSYNLASLLAEFLAPYASSASDLPRLFFLLRAILKTRPATRRLFVHRLELRSTPLQRPQDGDQIKTRFQGRA